MDRRNFLKISGVGGVMMALSPSIIRGKLYADDGRLFTAYEKVQLVDANGKALKATALKEEINYVFNYPFVGTPAILLDLGVQTQRDIKLFSEEGEEYIWKGGVGEKKSLVAYSAICSHQLAHPTPADSFLQYLQRGKTTIACKQKGGLVVCSSHLSAFDPSKGCKKVAGPAEQPLASIILEVAEDDTLWVSAVLGPDKFHEYFKRYKTEMKKFYGGKRKAKKWVKEHAITVVLDEYTKEIIQY
ncbi:Rieske 2Fe-2S domain-containing protein [Sulfurimonas sediminis]|uniref:Rieske 2Fe-2S domain-containing protein n=1 Tax=Sulfurimonas sediminis TaxID=2590020 RepID=A0A7M1B4A4_9BACT|nr:Rieske 2Fe-2S domain-containing protein [Sulfurimonas sediminis]QOP44569.1 Rieske 2Fe-2S domain-containing protein [Sulfurimonas sediminis]